MIVKQKLFASFHEHRANANYDNHTNGEKFFLEVELDPFFLANIRTFAHVITLTDCCEYDHDQAQEVFCKVSSTGVDNGFNS